MRSETSLFAPTCACLHFRGDCMLEKAGRRMRAQTTEGKVIVCKAAVCWAPRSPLDVTSIEVAPPRAHEVRVQVLFTALCHTDVYTMEGHDPEGLFPFVPGHESTAIVESVGQGVDHVAVGDLVVPCYTPQCRRASCIFCANEESNLCPAIRGSQGRGVMPDGSSRLSKDGQLIHHFMGTSTFAEFAVLADISVAKINASADPKAMALLGCGISTGWGAVFNTVKMRPRSSVAVFGLGALGLSVIQASRVSGATKIVGVDMLASKLEAARAMGATECLDASKESDVKKALMQTSQWGYDYTFDCTGNVNVMNTALEVAHRGWGQSCIIGVAAAGKQISTRPFQLVTGRQWKGVAFGNWKSRDEVPQLVQRVMRGEMDLKAYITHTFDTLDDVNESIKALHSGNCLRAVVQIGRTSQNSSNCREMETKGELIVTPKGSNKLHGGSLRRYSHWSSSCKCEMTFSIFLPSAKSRPAAKFPVLFYLSGLTCSDDNARAKLSYASEANRLGLAIVFPDTSPRGVDVAGADDSYDLGTGAGFYVNATQEPWSKHYHMYDYVTNELPELIANLFHVDVTKMAITGHSMGGHGALVCHLRNPGKYASVSAFAPIANPVNAPWGKKVFENYLGSVEAGKAYDATELVKKYTGPKPTILIDQGTSDEFLDNQLMPEALRLAAAEAGYPIKMRMQADYDHSYFFITSFFGDHLAFHAAALGLSGI